MLCDTCRLPNGPASCGRAAAQRAAAPDEMIPCPDCGGQGIGHCCDGICEQPDLGAQQSPGRTSSNVVHECDAASAVTSTIVQRGPVSIEVLAQGAGHRVVLLPSLGRGATDFDVMAERIAAAGYRVLRPQPRGIGRSTQPRALRRPA